jgi:hypothetical protein
MWRLRAASRAEKTHPTARSCYGGAGNLVEPRPAYQPYPLPFFTPSAARRRPGARALASFGGDQSCDGGMDSANTAHGRSLPPLPTFSRGVRVSSSSSLTTIAHQNHRIQPPVRGKACFASDPRSKILRAPFVPASPASKVGTLFHVRPFSFCLAFCIAGSCCSCSIPCSPEQILVAGFLWYCCSYV